MRKSLLGLFFIFLVFAGYWQMLTSDMQPSAPTKPIVKIGVVTPLSGNMGVVGDGIKNAITMAKEDLSQRDLKYDYQFIIEDDSYEARKTATIFQKLSSLDHVDAVLSTFSQTGGIIAPLAERNKIPHLSLSSDANIVKGKYSFLDLTMPQYTAGRMLQFYKDKGFKKIVAIVPNNAGALPLEKALLEQIKPKDGISVVSHYVAPEETDFRMLLVKTKAENADAYLTLLYGASFATFFKQYKEAGETAPITSIETFAVLPDFALANGAYFTDAAAASEKFSERYEEKFGKASSSGVGNMYDMVMLMVQAFEAAADKSLAVRELSKIKSYDGVVGKLTQDKLGIFNSEAVLKHIKNGTPVISVCD